MDMDLQSYVKVYNCFDSNICDLTITQLEEADWQQHEFYSNVDDMYSPRNDKELDISLSNIQMREFITSGLFPIIKQYVQELDFSWYGSWSGYVPVKWNKYCKNKQMDLHCDHISDMFDGTRRGIPTLSAIVQLSNPSDYEGAELVFFEDTTINLKQGQVVIFPSNFLYPHRVKPVISGIRYSCVSWVW